MMDDEQEFKVLKFAEKEGVTERTVRTWIAKGAVRVRRTPGGGIRIIERRSDARASEVADTLKIAEVRGTLAG
jgi:DNA-binding transcriptional MerR regulator